MSAAQKAIENMEAGQAMALMPPSGSKQCPKGAVRIGVFFDGTSNNMYRDWPIGAAAKEVPPGDNNGPTNVAKLFKLYIKKGNVQKPIYHHGVGSDSARKDNDKKTSNETYWDGWGGGTGAGGKARVEWGLKQLADFYSSSGNALAVKKYYDTYGFSRGAAIARDFVNNVKTVGIDNLQEKNGFKYIAVGDTVIRVQAYKPHQNVIPKFLGVYDTVASFGLGGLETGNDLAGYNLFVDHKYVERTVHMVAEDEIRGNFPVSSLFVDPEDANLADSWFWWRRERAAKYKHPSTFAKWMIEIWYPGAHSDVGGSYLWAPAIPAEPERTEYIAGMDGYPVPITIPAKPYQPPKRPQLAHIPLEDMWKASKKAAVPLMPLSNLPKVLYEIPDDLKKAYDAYDAFREETPYSQSKRYIQTFESDTYRKYFYGTDASPLERLRLVRADNAGWKYMSSHFIHDSRWGTDKFFGRKQRTVLFMGPQPLPPGPTKE
jgi:uncharacterized protein (DUF2235 family)